MERNSIQCLGKLRAMNNERDRYVLYDNGDAWDHKNLIKNPDNIRKEHGAFIYRYEMCNVGNIRKMKIMFPQLNCYQVKDSSKVELTKTGKPKIKNEFSSEDKFKFCVDEYGPLTEEQTFLKLYEQDVVRQQQQQFDENSWFGGKYRLYVDNPPSWNPKCNSYVYNFKGRVTEASIKNFQLIPKGHRKVANEKAQGRQEYLL